MILTVKRTNVNIVSEQTLANQAKLHGSTGRVYAHKVYNYNLDTETKIPFNDDMEEIAKAIITTMLKDTGTGVMNLETTYTEETGVIAIRFINNGRMLFPEYTFEVMFRKNGRLEGEYLEDFESIVVKAV